jgi:hypothetical protein
MKVWITYNVHKGAGCNWNLNHERFVIHAGSLCVSINWGAKLDIFNILKGGSEMRLLAGFLLFLMIGALCALMVYWLCWQLWQWLIPLIWSAAPHGFAHPGYWLFVACLIIVCFIGGLLFGGKS